MYKKILLIIVLAGALARLIGLGFGLPLWVVGDEASLIFGALKMLEVRTILPALHPAEFKTILYYTPYLPYLYLPSFVGLIGVKWFFFAGNFAEFALLLKSNVAGFFWIARLYSVMFGTITIWLVYKIALNVFKKQTSALFSALCFALAFLPVSYGHWARHWSAMTMIFALIIYFLSRSDWSVAKRYLVISCVAAIGIGINLQVVFALIFVALWALFIDRVSLKQLGKTKWFWQATAIFLTGSAVAYFIWPPGFAFLNLLTQTPVFEEASSSKNFLGLLGSFGFYLHNLFKAEPLLLFLVIVGSVRMWSTFRTLIINIWFFVLFYIAVFYFVFNTMDRFILVLYPLFAIMAGYGWMIIFDFWPNQKNKFKYSVTILIILGLLLPIIKFDYLLLKNDTRIQAGQWLTTVPDNNLIAVLVPLMRLPTTVEATQKLQEIDPQALRTVDKAELELPIYLREKVTFNALNLYTVNPELLRNLPSYLATYQVKYLVITEDFATVLGLSIFDGSLGEVIKIIPGSVSSVSQDTTGHQSIPDGYGDGLLELFGSKNFGPDIVIIKLKHF